MTMHTGRAGTVLFALVLIGCGDPKPPTAPTPLPSTASAQTPLKVSTVQPTIGFAGYWLRVMGTGFASGATLRLGGLAAADIHVLGDTTIGAKAPSEGSGTVDVTVTNPDGSSDTLLSGFSYNVVTLTPDAISVAPSAEISVTWSAAHARCSTDWMGLFGVGEPSTDFDKNWWRYTSCGTGGLFRLSAPVTPGQYEFRYLLDDDYFDVARSAAITVK